MPPQIDDIGLGFRVPLLTISPYVAGRGLIDTEQGEFSTPLRFIADNWGLPYLTPRIEKTHNFAHVFDFGRKPRPPEIATAKAPAYGNAFKWPGDTYPWPAGTTPVSNPL
jgi:phospholipase C